MKLLFLMTPLLAALTFADNVAYTYDSAQRLAKVDYGNGTVINYSYDKSGNLVKRTVTKTAVVTPSFTAAAVVNAASFKGGAIAPGEMVTIFGSNIGPGALTGYQLANGVVSGSVAGTRFLFDGVPAPIIYVSAGQSTVMVPYAVAGRSSTQVVAEYQGVQSAPVSLPVAAAAPGLFTSAQNGTGQGAIVNQDGTINSTSAPIAKGSVVLLYLTGDGQTNPAGVDGQLALSALPLTAASVSVSIGGVDASIQYSGVAPQSIAGFTQFNVVVPAGAASGNAVPLVVSVGGITSPAGVTLAVR